MRLDKGLWKDSRDIDQPEGTWKDMLNGLYNKNTNSLTNELGFTVSNQYPTDLEPIGKISLNRNDTIIFSVKTDLTTSEIGLFDSAGVYTQIIRNATLTFQRTHPIHGKFTLNAIGERMIVFVDYYNPPRIINLDTFTTSGFDVNDIKLFKNFTTPVNQNSSTLLNTIAVNEGGTLLSGTYFIITQYENIDGYTTGWSEPSKQINITEDRVGEGFDNYDGCPENTGTSKSISGSLVNIDTNFDYLNVGYIQVIGGIISVKKFLKYNITAATLDIDILNNNGTEIPLDSYLIGNAVYENFRHIEYLNNSFYFAGIKEEEQLRYQKYANNIVVDVVFDDNTSFHAIDDLDESSKNNKVKGFRHFEVYALYIIFKLKSGGYSKAFHIPGRESVAGDTEDVLDIEDTCILSTPASFGTFPFDDPGLYTRVQTTPNHPAVSLTDVVTFLNQTDSAWNGETGIIVEILAANDFIVQHGFIGNSNGDINTSGAAATYDYTATASSTLASDQGITAKNYQVADNSFEAGATTNMGYWENQNETYPNDDEYDGTEDYDANAIAGGLDLRGDKVRHHRFPSIRGLKAKNPDFSGATNYMKDIFTIMGINVSNVVIPSEIADKVDGYYIGYAKRDYANSIVVGQTILEFSSEGADGTPGSLTPTGDGRIIPSGGNFILDEASNNNKYTLPWKEKLRLHPFDLLLDKPSISPSFITNEIKLELSIGTTAASIPTTGVIVNSTTERKYFLNFIDDAVASNVDTDKYLRKLENFKYVSANAIDGNIDNRGGEEFCYGEIDDTDTLDISVDTSLNITGLTTLREETYLTNICQLLSDVYFGFDSFKQLVLCNTYVPVTAAGTYNEDIWGGDVNICTYNIITTAPISYDEYPTVGNLGEGFFASKYFMCESINNIGLQYSQGDNSQSEYYPKNADVESTLDNYDIYQSRLLLYNKDYNYLNSFKTFNIFNYTDLNITEFPNDVVKSQQISRDSVNSAITFLIEDRYKITRNKGIITGLNSLDNNLIIRTENSLFLTVPPQRIKTDSLSIYLGSASNLFENDPRELITVDEGVAGSVCQDSAISTPFGLVVVDSKAGKIFLLTRELEEISKIGMRNYYFDQLLHTLTESNYILNGYSGNSLKLGYDSQYERLLITKTDSGGRDSFTYSFSFERKMWISQHSYSPYLYFNTRKALYSFGKNAGNQFIIAQHNNNSLRCRYYTSTNYDFYINIIFNEYYQDVKQFTNLEWNADVYDLNDALLNITFSDLDLYNKFIASLSKTLTVFDISTYAGNVRRRNGTWNFNNLRSNDSNWYDKERFIDKYLGVKLKFSASLISNPQEKIIYLTDVTANYRAKTIRKPLIK
jgi:hypothetical protein